MTLRPPIPRSLLAAFASILSAGLTGSLLLQGYFAIWIPSSFGLFAEFPAILLFAICISTVAFLVLVTPIHIWMRRTHGVISPNISFIVGLCLGCLSMLVFKALSGWPMRVGELLSGSIAGAVGVAVYAGLILKRGTIFPARMAKAEKP